MSDEGTDREEIVTPPRERLVIVIEYEADATLASNNPLHEAMEQLQQHLETPQPHVRAVQVHAAIKDDADQVLAVFDKEER